MCNSIYKAPHNKYVDSCAESNAKCAQNAPVRHAISINM
ncbi:hypothetical protein [Enterococcus phage PEF7b]